MASISTMPLYYERSIDNFMWCSSISILSYVGNVYLCSPIAGDL